MCPVLFPLLLLTLPAAAAAQPADPPRKLNADERAVRDVAKQLFTTYAEKKLDAFLALWSDKSPEYAAREKSVKQLYAETGALELKQFAVVRAHADGAAAWVRVRAEIVGNDVKTGKPHPGLGRMNRLIRLTKTDAGWRVISYVPAEPDLAERFAAAAAAAGCPAQFAVLAADRDLVGPSFL